MALPRLGAPARWRPIPAATAGLALLFALTACAAVVPPPEPTFQPQRYDAFVVPEPLLPLQARGAALFQYQGRRETGELVLQGSPGPAYALQLRARVTGSLALELRFDPGRLMLVDFVNEAYFLGANESANRVELFGVDLTPLEFGILATGRVPRDWYEAGRGTALTDGPVVVDHGAAVHYFWLGPDGLPERWVKTQDGATTFRVAFQAYAEATPANGSPLRLPQKVRLYVQADTPLLVLGISEFHPGRAGPAPVSLAALPDGAHDFAPMELPPPGSGPLSARWTTTPTPVHAPACPRPGPVGYSGRHGAPRPLPSTRCAQETP